MIRAEQIPPEAYAAAAELLAEGARTDQAIAAAINAWPGMSVEKTHIGVFGNVFSHDIILPLPKENSND